MSFGLRNASILRLHSLWKCATPRWIPSKTNNNISPRILSSSRGAWERQLRSSSTTTTTTFTTPTATKMRVLDQLHTQPAAPTWREASSLVILAKDDQIASTASPHLDFDYRVLMVKRSNGSSFMASAYVFPGGQVEVADFDHRWYELYAQLGFTRADLDAFSTDIVGPRPPIIDQSVTLSKLRQDNVPLLASDIGLRISAIRETFEEAGILLLTSLQDQQANSENCCTAVEKLDNFADWQLKVRKDPKAFFDLCHHLRLVPNIWSLYEWSDWLTPVSVGHRRFDTIFYVCCLQRVPKVMVDNAEITKSMWCTPTEILEQHRVEKVFLAPPQAYELSRMIRLPHLDRLRLFARARQVLGTERWLPIILTYDDGALSVLPGDGYYPHQPELISAAPVAELEGTVDEANKQHPLHQNRIELRGTQSQTLVNINLGCGHLVPITYPPSSDEMKQLRSKL